MGKKVREYKSGDFIFAKVKGYPAWPARVQRPNGKKYFVYFYGTGETANLPPNMIFDYAENKDKFLTKTVKRKDFNDGVKQIEHDFANNVPLEQVIGHLIQDGNGEEARKFKLFGISPQEPPANANDTANNQTLDEVMAEITADETINDTTRHNDTGVEDSDETGALVIDEGKQQQPKGRKSKADIPKTPATPKAAPKTPRGKAKKEENKKEGEDELKKEEEIVSRSGRKIRPKRYIDEQTEENTTLPSPAPKKRRVASPPPETKDKQEAKEKPETKDKAETKDKPAEKNSKLYTAVTQSELEDIKEPLSSDEADKTNILIAYLPSGQYVGVKLFQSRPNSFKNEASLLQWEKQAAANAITLKTQLEKGHITPQSVCAQLEMDLNLTDEEKASLDKERELEERKSRVQFLKAEMKLIELDAKIKTCLSLDKADTELCLKLLDELLELDVKPLMLLKHPTCLETVKRLRAYVGNTPSWDLSESAALVFSKQAHVIRKQADNLYRRMKELFTSPEGLSFWEYFSARVLHFKKATANLTADELLEMVHEPLEMSMPTAHTMQTAVDTAVGDEPAPELDSDTPSSKKATPVKSKKNAANTTPAKTPVKRQSSRNKVQPPEEKENEEDDKSKEETVEETTTVDKAPESTESNDKTPEVTETLEKETETAGEKETQEIEASKDAAEPMEVDQQESNEKQESEETEKTEPSADAKVEKQKEKEAEKQETEEPRAKRTRESKKTEPPAPRTPTKRRSIKS